MREKKKHAPFLKKSPGEKSNTPLFLQFSGRTLSHEKYPFTGHFGNTHAVIPTSEWGGGGGPGCKYRAYTFEAYHVKIYRGQLIRIILTSTITAGVYAEPIVPHCVFLIAFAQIHAQEETNGAVDECRCKPTGMVHVDLEEVPLYGPPVSIVCVSLVFGDFVPQPLPDVLQVQPAYRKVRHHEKHNLLGADENVEGVQNGDFFGDPAYRCC